MPLPYHCELHLGTPTVLTRYQQDGPEQEYLGWELARGESMIHVSSAITCWDLRTYVTIDMIQSGHLGASVSRWRQRPGKRGEDRLQEQLCAPTTAAVLREWLEAEAAKAAGASYGMLVHHAAHREAWNSALVVLIACDVLRDIRSLRW